jgi:AhpD family alkylhydroperoxidase
MNRIAIPTVEQSPAASLPLLEAVNKQLGVIPNLMKLVGNSPAALEGYLSLSGALGKGVLSAPLRERIALTIAEYNGCDYCLAAHSYLGKNLAKLSDEEIGATPAPPIRKPRPRCASPTVSPPSAAASASKTWQRCVPPVTTPPAPSRSSSTWPSTC